MTHFLFHSSLLYGSNEEPPKRAEFKFMDHIGEDFLIKQYSNMECWLHRKHPDGQWVTMRIVTAEELDKYFNTALAKWIENAGIVKEGDTGIHSEWNLKYGITERGYKEDHFYMLDVECEIVNEWWNPSLGEDSSFDGEWCICSDDYPYEVMSKHTEMRKVCRLKGKDENSAHGYSEGSDLESDGGTKIASAWDQDDLGPAWARHFGATEEIIEKVWPHTKRTLYNIDTELYKNFGFRTEAEYEAYNKGREHGENVTEQFVKDWDGSRNSVFGCVLWEKYTELKAKSLI